MTSAARKNGQDGVTIFVAGDCGVQPDILNIYMNQESSVQIELFSGAMEGLQALSRKGRGILVVRIEKPGELTSFAKILQIFIKGLKLSEVKIVIISERKEILNNRTLTQFNFIRTIPPPKDMQKLSGLLFRDAAGLEERSTRRAEKVNIGTNGIMIIRGEESSADPQGPWTESRPITSQKENPLFSIVGAKNPSFLYDKSCLWRVRGHFSAYDPVSTKIVFHADDEIGTRRVKSVLKQASHIISSTSSPRARICMTLDPFVGRDNQSHREDEFVFKTPSLVQEVQRRAQVRISMNEDEPVICQFTDDKNKEDIFLSVLDISAGGLGVRLDRDLIKNFQAGQIINNISVVFPQRTIKIFSAEIRHHSRSDIDPQFKILGLKFVDVDKNDKVFLGMYVDARRLG